MGKLSGYKTYALSGAMALFGIIGLLLGQLEPDRAWEILLQAGAIAGLRNAIK